MASAQAPRTRVIAGEEHFVTDDHLDAAANLQEGPGEEAERSFIDGFAKSEQTRGRVADLEPRLREMNSSGPDLAVAACLHRRPCSPSSLALAHAR